jgi:hypothetical protein
MKTEIKETAKELGFISTYSPMSEEQTHQFMSILLGEMKEGFEEMMSSEEAPFPIQILNKRVELMELPISFTAKAKMLALILTEGNPGRIMTVLIDCLTRFEGQEVDDYKLIQVYPEGFYSENSFIDLVDNYFKLRKVKWSEIY